MAPAQNAGQPHATGLVRPTAQQVNWMQANAQRVQAVQHNSLALQRMNATRQARGLAPMSAAPVPFGSEVVPVGVAGPAALTTTVDVGLPAAVDNSTLPAFPPIRSQGGIGSCACWASAYYMGTHMMGLARGLNNKNDADNTTKLSPKWCYNMINGGADQGSWFTPAFELMLKNGAASWADFPYDGNGSNSRNYTEWPTDAAVWRRAISNRFSAAGEVTSLNTATGVTNLKALLNNGYVCVFATNVYGWTHTTIGNDPATTADDAFAGRRIASVVKSIPSGHAMTVVGYNDNLWADLNNNARVDAGEKGAFRIANSWGTGWEDSGFTWLSYDALKATSAVSGADNASREAAWWYETAWYLTARASYTPTLLAQFTLSHARRSQMSVSLGRSATTTTTPTSTWLGGALRNQGGNLAFDGGSTAVNGSFVFDLSELAQSGTQRYYVSVGDNATGSPAGLVDFRVTNASGSTLHTAAAGIPSSADGNTARAYANTGSTPPVTDDYGNTLATAFGVSIPGSVNGNLEVGTDTDMLRFILTTAANVTLASSSSIDPTGTLFNSAGSQLAFNDDSNGRLDFTIAATLQPGTYYLAVRPYSTSVTGAYRVNLSATPVTTPGMAVAGLGGLAIADGDFSPVTSDGTVFAAITTRGGTRSQSFTVRSSGTAPLVLNGSPLVQISGSGAAHFRVGVLPASTINPGAATTFSITYQPAAMGTHDATISVRSNDARTSPYEFAVRGSASFPVDDHGNTMAAATAVRRPSQTAGNLETSGDVDFFRFTLTASATVVIQTSSSIDTYGYLYNASGSLLAYDDDAGAGYNFYISRTLPAGTYYLRVKGYSTSTVGAYTLRVD